ncbi:sugar ABC transporter substrate-binding protein [Streptomyces sp. NPDC002596]
MRINSLPRNRAAGAALLAVALIVPLSACGAAQGTTEKAADSKTVAAARGSAQALVDKASGRTVFSKPGDAFDISAARGKTIYVVTLDNSIPYVRAVLNGMTEAGRQAGVNVRVFDSKGSTSTAGKGVEQALATDAAAVVAFGINLSEVSGAVRAAQQAKVPVISAFNVDANAPLEEGAAGAVSVDFYDSGRILAAHAVTATDGPVHASYQHLPSVATFTALKKGLQDGFKEFCRSGCSLSVDDLNQADFKQGAERVTSSTLMRNRKLNWVFPAIDGIAQFTVPAVEAANRPEVQTSSINAVTANLEFVRDGRVQSADIGNNNSWLGWAMMDRSLRAIAGQKADTTVVPLKLFVKDNLKGKDLADEDALFDGADYRGGFTALWKTR